jgi:hypothetical protein
VALALVDGKPREQRDVRAGCDDDAVGMVDGTVAQGNGATLEAHCLVAMQQCGTGLGGEVEEVCGRCWWVQHGVVRHEEATGESGTEVRLGEDEGLGVENVGADARGCVEALLGVDFQHLFEIGGDPDGTARFILHGAGQLRGEFLPERAGEAGEGELRVRIVHDDDVSHASCGSRAADGMGFDDAYTQASLREFKGAGAADDSGT